MIDRSKGYDDSGKNLPPKRPSSVRWLVGLVVAAVIIGIVLVAVL